MDHAPRQQLKRSDCVHRVRSLIGASASTAVQIQLTAQVKHASGNAGPRHFRLPITSPQNGAMAGMSQGEMLYRAANTCKYVQIAQRIQHANIFNNGWTVMKGKQQVEDEGIHAFLECHHTSFMKELICFLDVYGVYPMRFCMINGKTLPMLPRPGTFDLYTWMNEDGKMCYSCVLRDRTDTFKRTPPAKGSGPGTAQTADDSEHQDRVIDYASRVVDPTRAVRRPTMRDVSRAEDYYHALLREHGEDKAFFSQPFEYDISDLDISDTRNDIVMQLMHWVSQIDMLFVRDYSVSLMDLIFVVERTPPVIDFTATNDEDAIRLRSNMSLLAKDIVMHDDIQYDFWHTSKYNSRSHYILQEDSAAQQRASLEEQRRKGKDTERAELSRLVNPVDVTGWSASIPATLVQKAQGAMEMNGSSRIQARTININVGSIQEEPETKPDIDVAGDKKVVPLAGAKNEVEYRDVKEIFIQDVGAVFGVPASAIFSSIRSQNNTSVASAIFQKQTLGATVGEHVKFVSNITGIILNLLREDRPLGLPDGAILCHPMDSTWVNENGLISEESAHLQADGGGTGGFFGDNWLAFADTLGIGPQMRYFKRVVAHEMGNANKKRRKAGDSEDENDPQPFPPLPTIGVPRNTYPGYNTDGGPELYSARPNARMVHEVETIVMLRDAGMLQHKDAALCCMAIVGLPLHMAQTEWDPQLAEANGQTKQQPRPSKASLEDK